MSPAPGRDVPPMPEEGEPTQRRQTACSTASCPGSRTDPLCRQPQLEASSAGRHSRSSWGAISLWTPPLERGLEGALLGGHPGTASPCAHSLGPRSDDKGSPSGGGVRGAVGAPYSRDWAGDPEAGGLVSKAQIPRLPRLRPPGSAGAGGAGEGSLKSPAALPAGSQNTAQLNLLLSDGCGLAPGIRG